MTGCKVVRRCKNTVERKRCSAQITVYAAISLGLVLSLICTCIQSVKLAVADAEINMAARLSTEAVFAGYNNKLLSEFGIFAISKEQCCDEKLDYYAVKNAEAAAVRDQITYSKSFVSNLAYMTDNGGYGLAKQVSEYMRAGGYAQIIKDFLDIDTETKKTETINEVTAKVSEAQEELCELDETDRKLIKLVRSMDSSSKSGLISDICEDIEWYSASVKAEDAYGAQDFENAYEKNREVLLEYLKSTMESCREALSLIAKYDETDKKADTILSECRNIINSNADSLSDISSTLKNDVDDIAVAKTTDREKKINKSRIKPILENNIDVCEQLISRIESMETLSVSNASRYLSEYSDIMMDCEQINITGLLSECGDADIDSKGDGLGMISKIRGMIDNGISGIVLSGMEVKQGSCSRSGLAAAYQSSGGTYTSGAGSDFNGVAGEVIDAALFNAYLLQKFPSYTDVHGTDSAEYEGWSELNYVIEYILAGNDNDVSNLNEVILKLSAVREATNFTHIILDSGKRREALALATTLVGASGSAAAIKAAQYVIMGVWSYGESVVDVRRLLKGEELSLVKTSGEWKLSLDNLVKMNFDTDSNDGGGSSGSTGKFSYEDYIGILLLMMDQTTKNYRTMQAMELRIIALGQEDFRMKQHVYEAVCNVSMTLDYGGQTIERSQRYSYADG